MTSALGRSVAMGCAALVALLAGGCKGGEQAARPAATGAAGTAAGTEVALKPFTGNIAQAEMGRYDFVRFNCYGCHGGLAGGAMGPSLRDTVWKYGGSDQQIYSSIHDGRPMGMPKWAGTLSDSQINDIIAYIHSLRTTKEPKFFFISNDSLKKALGIAMR